MPEVRTRSRVYDVILNAVALAVLVYTLIVWLVTGRLDRFIAVSSVIFLAFMTAVDLVEDIVKLRRPSR